jgi:AraC-like DNA-binding protein
VVAIAPDVGCANPSHFAQLFRRETGLTPERLPAATVNREPREICEPHSTQKLRREFHEF